jgi:hypothetical protein
VSHWYETTQQNLISVTRSDFYYFIQVELCELGNANLVFAVRGLRSSSGEQGAGVLTLGIFLTYMQTSSERVATAVTSPTLKRYVVQIRHTSIHLRF